MSRKRIISAATRRRTRAVAAFAALGAAAFATVATADQLQDELGSNGGSVDVTLGEDRTGSGSGTLVVRCTGTRHASTGAMAFNVSKAVVDGPAGSDAEVAITPSLAVPAGWPADGTNCGSASTVTGSFGVSVTVPADAPAGARTIKVTISSTQADVTNQVNTFVTYTVAGSGGGDAAGDTTAPDPPTIDLAASSDSGRSDSDDVTNDNTPTLEGTAEAGSTVEVFDGTTSLGTTSAASDGSWSLTPLTALSNGTHAFTAKATDAANNTSSPSSALNVLIDTAAPDLGLSTSNAANSTVCATSLPAKPTANPTDALSGIWAGTFSETWTTPNAPSGAGTYTYSASVKDNAGNTASHGPTDYVVTYGDISAGGAFSGYLQPINLDGSSRFKLGSTVPVKFGLMCGSTPIANAVARLTVSRADSVADPGVDEAISTAAATTGNLFRYDATAQQYIFNLSTKSGFTNPNGQTVAFSTGSWRLSVVFDDGSHRSVIVQLPK